MSDKQEMLADIVNEIRARAGAWPDEKLKQYDLRLADRIEEAARREAANRKLNENSKSAQFEFCNAAKLREVVMQMERTANAARTCNANEDILRDVYLDDIIKLCTTALALFIDSSENENSGAAIVKSVNYAKLREMVVEIPRIIVQRQRASGTAFSSDDAIINIVNAILATPPRNCDRYTGEDINRDVADAYTRADNDLMLDYDCEELPIRWLLSTTAQVDEYLKHKDDEHKKMWRAIYDRRQQEATE